MRLQQRGGGIDGADDPAELVQMFAPAPPKLSTVGITKILQHSVEQMLGCHGGRAPPLGMAGGQMHGSLGEERRPAQRRAPPPSATPPGPPAGPPDRRPKCLRTERRDQPLAYHLHIDPEGPQGASI